MDTKQKSPRKTSLVSLRVPDALNEQLNELSRKTAKSKSAYILEAVKQALPDFERQAKKNCNKT